MLPHHNLKLQNYALAIRQELGFPLIQTANQSTKFTAGGELDLLQQVQAGALAQEMSRDLIHCVWTSVSAKAPVSIAVVYREELLVDFIDGCTLWAADSKAPLMLLNERGGEHFVRGGRGALERKSGLPASNLARGKRLAAQRVRKTAAGMGADILSGNTFVPHGGRWADHKPAMQDEALVRLI